ncbi:MAG TPA: C4-dicarboxylate ABC transporter permease [Syntrophobacteraceae bacterium]|nr:C4-dicarboxylate ABC transporter permease [Syntrophobacteraceae bacterium]
MIPTVLLGSLALLFVIHTPVALAIGLASLLAFVVKGDFSLLTVVQRLYAGVDSFPLMAVPLFMCAGEIMEAGGISRRIVNLADALVGWLPGGMAAVAIVSSMFFAGISGSSAADTAAVGTIMLPAMIRGGYERSFASAVQASGGSLGVIIPPSIPMIIFGFLTGASIGKLFVAGILPGLLIGTSLIALATVLCRQRHYGATTGFSWRRVVFTAWDSKWALGAPVVILGGILGGIFTATESAAVAVLYALFVGFCVHRQLRLPNLPQLFIRAAVTAGVVMFIIATASVFSWIMAVEHIPEMIATQFLALTQNPTVLLLMINLLLLLAGCFIETTAALILLVPVLLPVLPRLPIDAVQLGAIVVVNLAIGMLTPPLGICLFVACSISGARIEDTVRSILPFLGLLLVDLMIITFWDPMTAWLPGLFYR